MAENIAQWLDGLGLGQYAQGFADNGIDIEALPHLRDEDFERLGVLLGDLDVTGKGAVMAVGAQRDQRLLWVNYGLRRLPSFSSAFGGKAEVDFERLDVAL